MSVFATADYVVFAFSILISLSIGIIFAYRSRKRQTTEDYLLANRKLKAVPVALSVAVSFESAITMLGIPAETYRFGMVYIWSVSTFPLTFLIGMNSLVPLIYPLRITSIYELRFQSGVPRMILTILGMLQTIFYMGIIMFGPATAIEAAAKKMTSALLRVAREARLAVRSEVAETDDDSAQEDLLFTTSRLFRRPAAVNVTPFPYWCSIILAAVIAIIYTTIGGIRAVVWTDVFQTVVMTAGMFAIIVKAGMIAGGISNVFVIASENGRLNLFKFKPDLTERNFWTLFVGGCFSHFNIVLTQTSTQRVLSVPKKQEAKKVLWISGVIMFIFASLACLVGIFAFAYFHTIGCDPLSSKQITNSNQIIPLMAALIFQEYPGITGLYIAALFSATLSSLSSGLNSLAALTTEDFIKPYFKNLTEFNITMIAKISVLVYGLISVALSFVIANVKGPMTQMFGSTMSSITGPITGMFILAMFCPWASKKGSLIGILAGVILVSWISFGQNLSTTLQKEHPLSPASVRKCPRVMTNMSSATDGYNWNIYNGTDIPKSGLPERTGLDKLYSLNFKMFSLVGVITTLIVGSLVSVLTGKPNRKDITVEYMLPFFDNFFPCLPARVKHVLHCGFEFVTFYILFIIKHQMEQQIQESLRRDNVEEENPFKIGGKFEENIL